VALELLASSEPAVGDTAKRFANWRLFVLSSAALYLEIVLIRWLGTEVKIFAFFQNLSLIVCFLGFGVGCFTSGKRGSVLPSIAATTTLIVAVNLPFNSWHVLLKTLSSVLSFTADAALWGNVNGLNSIVTSSSGYYEYLAISICVVAAFLMLVSIAMIPLGRWVGYYLESSADSIGAYSMNLAGSLVGIWLLAFLAFLWLSPTYWFAVAFVLIMLGVPFSWRSSLLAAAMLVVAVAALWPHRGPSVAWSPYQKLSLTDAGNQQYQIDVNNEGYMSIANVTPGYLAQNPAIADTYTESSYDSPFQFASSVQRVLVVGAGAGNDVAAALRHGAAHVDAVEIDPMISTLGRHLHPEKPYASPRVSLITNDARNFLRQNHDKYDVIIFGLLDSHTEFSGYSNMRVDNYVYTQQSFLDAKQLLSPNGILVLKFEVRQPWTWIGQRFYSMLTSIFVHPPITYYAPQIGMLTRGTVFIESNSPDFVTSSLSTAKLAFIHSHPPAFPLELENAPPPTTDDWPYVYHLGHSIPRAYLSVSLVIALLASYLVGPFFKPRETGTWIFFLLGAGFLLMETQLVSRLALYFGSTWLVNCIALTGVLSVLLLANVYVQRRQPDNLKPYYLTVCASLLVDYAIPWDRIPGPGAFVGFLICFAYCVPIFFAGVVFTESFRRTSGKSEAFGANMLGAVAGGLAQNLSFIFGMKALLLAAALVYGCGILLQIVRPLKSVSPSIPAR
jgi:spermidine synthase